MSETIMSDYIKGFDAGIDCTLTEIERLAKEEPITAEKVIRLLDPQRDIKTAQKPEKAPSSPISRWVGLSTKEIPDQWRGNRAFLAGARWAAKQLKGKNK
jgi:hypothetical protein